MSALASVVAPNANGNLQQQQRAIISPSPEPRLSDINDDEIAEFLESVDNLEPFEDQGDLDQDCALEEDQLDSFFPKFDMDKLKTLPDLFASVNEDRTAPQQIAEALQSLPIEKREQIVRDLYGIEKEEATLTATTNHVTDLGLPVVASTGGEENTYFLDQKLLEMEEELKRIKKTNVWNLKLVALELAERQSLEYTQDRVFRLKFLRCDRFHVVRAAGRFIRYFDWKLELFGEGSLTREITIDDLTGEDRAMLKKGYLQRLPVRDRAGRSILCSIYNGQVYESPESLVRQYFYVACNSDEETDQRGHINIFFKIKDFTFKRSTRALGGCFYLYRGATDIPFRADAYHKFLETEPSVMHKIVDYAVDAMHPELRARTCVHYGKYNDWMNVLAKFGIPLDVIPFTQSYKIKTKNHQEYMAMRAKKEEILASVPATITADKLIDLPSRKDVLLGKGKPIQFSSGNQRISSIIDGYLDQYHEHSSKTEKTVLASRIVDIVKASGVRFLSKERGIWLEVSHDLARDKVSHMFRHQRHNNGSKRTNPGIASSSKLAPTPASNEQVKRAKI